MIVGSLFAGIGGFDEGLRQAGMESSWQVEKEPFCLKVLKTRFPNAERAADILTCRGLTSSVPASHARIGRSRERERDCLERAAASFTSLQESCTSFDPLGSCSRMFPDFSVVTTDETLRKSSGFSWSSAGMGFNGVCLTASFSESPRDAAVCSLSDVLESHAPQRFFLSQKAAQGILRRAESRGKPFPTHLALALEALSSAPDGKDKTFSLFRTFAEERETKPTRAKASGLGKADRPTPSESLSNTRSASNRDMPEMDAEHRKNSCHRSRQNPDKLGREIARLWSVRRLTPTECEVLQGFPKGWTLPDTELLGTPSPFPSSSGLEIESSSLDR